MPAPIATSARAIRAIAIATGLPSPSLESLPQKEASVFPQSPEPVEPAFAKPVFDGLAAAAARYWLRTAAIRRPPKVPYGSRSHAITRPALTPGHTALGGTYAAC